MDNAVLRVPTAYDIALAGGQGGGKTMAMPLRRLSADGARVVLGSFLRVNGEAAPSLDGVEYTK